MEFLLAPENSQKSQVHSVISQQVSSFDCLQLLTRNCTRSRSKYIEIRDPVCIQLFVYIYILYEFCIQTVYIMFMMYTFCRSELICTKCIQNFCIQNVSQISTNFCKHFVYISCIHLVQLLYTKCIHSFHVGQATSKFHPGDHTENIFGQRQYKEV